MLKFDLEDYVSNCPGLEDLKANGFTLYEDKDGTVKVFNEKGSQMIWSYTKSCCESWGYTFDDVNQKCRWSKPTSSVSDDFKIILNPQGNSGVFFNVDENETCCLDVSFDYLFKFDCNELYNSIRENVTVAAPVPTEEVAPVLTETQAQITKNEELIEYYQNLILEEENKNIPYVIQCERTSTVLNPVRDIKSVSIKKSAFTPPLSFAVPTTITNYCLTDEGLILWQNILGPTKYAEWLASHGSNVSMYTCAEVNKLVQSGSQYYTSKCDYTIYDKSVSVSKIEKWQIEIKKLQGIIRELTAVLQEGPALTEQVDGPVLNTKPKCTSYIDFFENLKISFTIETLNSNNLYETVYEDVIFYIGPGNFLDYINNASGATGILISGATGIMPTINQGSVGPIPPLNFDLVDGESVCRVFRDELAKDVWDLYSPEEKEVLMKTKTREELYDLVSTWYQSCWLEYSKTICDEKIINSLNGKTINISLKVENSCADFSIMLDRLKLNKNCTKVDNLERYISEPPKFNIKKVIDNKKSWLANKERDERFYDLKYRPAEYNTNHHKLVINTKEIDLNLSPARGVEQDTWCFLPNILGCPTGDTNSTEYLPTDKYYSHPADCPPYNDSCASESHIVTYHWPIGVVDVLDDYATIPTVEQFETIQSCLDGNNLDDLFLEYRIQRDIQTQQINNYHIYRELGYNHDDVVTFLGPNYALSGINTTLSGDSSFSGYPITYFYNQGDGRKLNFTWWRKAYLYEEYTLPLSALTGACPVSGQTLYDIFGPTGDFVYLDAVSDYNTLTGITGNAGDIRYAGPLGSNTRYFWNPITLAWEDLDAYDCLAEAINVLLSTRNARRNAMQKAKNQMFLAMRPFLYSNLYIPQFQVKKYILT